MGVRRGGAGEGGGGGCWEGGGGGGGGWSLNLASAPSARGPPISGGEGGWRGGVATPIDHSETGVMSVSPGGGWGVYLLGPLWGLRGPPPGTRNFVKFRSFCSISAKSTKRRTSIGKSVIFVKSSKNDHILLVFTEIWHFSGVPP